MTSQSPRIYIYKITFEEVPYYYYGVHKEKRYNEEYWGSPITHKWCWELYTPKKQILEIFDYTDEGWLKAQVVEKRLIQPVFNTDKWCLNESCGGKTSLKILSQNGKRAVKTHKKLGIGFYKLTPEERKKICRKAGYASIKRQKELGIGFYAVPKEVRSKNGKKSKELCVGIHSLTSKEKSINGKKGALKNKKNKVGIFSLTKEQLSNQGKKSNSQKWMCLETGYVSTAAGVVSYQKGRCIDTSKENRRRIS